MVEISKYQKLFCGQDMLNKYKQECQTVYEKTIPLEVLRIPNGIVHPLQPFDKNDFQNTALGGVTDEKLNFIELSLTKRVSPPNFTCEFNDWYKGASPNYDYTHVDYVDEDVVFLGALSAHYGHFITEGLARLWFYLDSGNMHYKGVYISEDGDGKFNDCFKFFGIKDQDIARITKPTKFRSVIVPEQSIRLHDFYHVKYKEVIDKIKEKIEPAEYKKVYFSKLKSNSGRAIGEPPIKEVFFKNNFSIFSPEQMSMHETISVLKGCNVFAATSGTNMHNSVFMNDGDTSICLNRSAHFHPLQTMIDRMKNLECVYVDVFFFSSNKNFGNVPCLLVPTKFLFNFFEACIGSGIGETIRDYASACCKVVGISPEDHLIETPGYEAEYPSLVSGSSRIRSLGWVPEVDLSNLALRMINAELSRKKIAKPGMTH